MKFDIGDIVVVVCNGRPCLGIVKYDTSEPNTDGLHRIHILEDYTSWIDSYIYVWDSELRLVTPKEILYGF